MPGRAGREDAEPAELENEYREGSCAVTGDDGRYLEDLVEAGYVQSPCLELGAGLAGANFGDLLRRNGIEYWGADRVPGTAVDFVFDLDEPMESILSALSSVGEFGSVLLANVLEHTFDPIRALDKACVIMRPGGTCIIITPAVWPLHEFPIDCWRPMPSFYTEYARRRNLNLLQDTFRYVGHGLVSSFTDNTGALAFPRPGKSLRHDWYSRVVHRLFKTHGRGMVFPSHVAIGVVLEKPSVLP